MSLRYIEGSLRRINENSIGFKLINYIESGAGYINLKVLLDGEDVTEESSIKIGGQEERKVKPYMFVSSNYGDEVAVTISREKPIRKGPHKIKVECTIDMLGFYSTEFEGEV
ncbi:hypothetical protein CW702_01465 [Candidatus Bathyarchaeota archaeon]|nr:MAG: hypothetical protein CW702_01465 [Candidatus Bathyarchaeota archaeon]